MAGASLSRPNASPKPHPGFAPSPAPPTPLSGWQAVAGRSLVLARNGCSRPQSNGSPRPACASSSRQPLRCWAKENDGTPRHARAMSLFLVRRRAGARPEGALGWLDEAIVAALDTLTYSSPSDTSVTTSADGCASPGPYRTPSGPRYDALPVEALVAEVVRRTPNLREWPAPRRTTTTSKPPRTTQHSSSRLRLGSHDGERHRKYLPGPCGGKRRPRASLVCGSRTESRATGTGPHALAGHPAFVPPSPSATVPQWIASPCSTSASGSAGLPIGLSPANQWPAAQPGRVQPLAWSIWAPCSRASLS